MVMKKQTDTQLENYLFNWNKMNRVLCKLPEESVKRMLVLEKNGKDRTHILKRLHQRYTRMRKDREFRELMK